MTCPSSFPKDQRFSNLVVDQNAVLRCQTVANNLQVQNTLKIDGGEPGDILTNTGNGQSEWLPPGEFENVFFQVSLESVDGLPRGGPFKVRNLENLVLAASDNVIPSLTQDPSTGTTTAEFGAGAQGYRNVGFVDLTHGNDHSAAIGTLRAFKTIQAFVEAVPAGDDSTLARNVYTAIISPGDYDEDLTIDLTRRRIVLTGFGSWNLGTFDGSDWSPSGTRRNITVTITDANIDGIRSGLVISTFLDSLGEAMTTHESYLTKVRISGMIDLTGANASGSVELVLACEVFGDGGISIDAGATIIQSYFSDCRMRGSVTGTNWQFQVTDRSRFQGLVTVGNFSLIQSSRFDAGMTIAGTPPAGLRPYGMVNTWFAGTFTGPASSLLLDGYTNYFFKLNGASLAGGATKVILFDSVP